MLQRLAGSGNCLSHEKNYIEDPKKALKSFFDREGLDPEYEFVEGKFGQQICRIECVHFFSFFHCLRYFKLSWLPSHIASAFTLRPSFA